MHNQLIKYTLYVLGITTINNIKVLSTTKYHQMTIQITVSLIVAILVQYNKLKRNHMSIALRRSCSHNLVEKCYKNLHKWHKNKNTQKKQKQKHCLFLEDIDVSMLKIRVKILACKLNKKSTVHTKVLQINRQYKMLYHK